MTPGVGGIGGVGGEAPGGAVDDPTKTLLLGTPQMPAKCRGIRLCFTRMTASVRAWRGVFAPLLQWQSTHTSTAVYVHLSQENYDFRILHGCQRGARAHRSKGLADRDQRQRR